MITIIFQLVVLNKDSTVSLYSVHGDSLGNFKLLKNVKSGVAFGSTFFKQKETGVFIADNSQQMYCVNSVSQRTPWSLSPPQSTVKIYCLNPNSFFRSYRYSDLLHNCM